MFTRDSFGLWIAFAFAVVTYLSTAGNPADWQYSDWINAASFVLAYLSGKLATSPLPGKSDPFGSVGPRL